MTSLKHARPAIGLAHATLAKALDIAFPPRCPSCHTGVAAEGNFCAPCFDKLHLIAPPLCKSCGVPFAVAAGEEATCPECIVNPPTFKAARAVMVYDEISAPLISALKFQDQWAGLARYARMMNAVGADILPGVEIILPVPLHWARLLRRKYNQAALLAFAIGELTDKPVRTDLLKRVVATRPQMKLDRATRLKNVRRAFALSEQAGSLIAGKTLLLVDDVMTTGATVDACAAVLKEGGAKEVRVLALARTVRA